MEALSGHDDAELVTVAALLQKLPPLPSVFHDLSESCSSSSQSPRSNPAATTTSLGDKSDSGKRKIVSCLDCHSRKVKCSKTRPVCEQCIKRGKQDTCVYELAEDDEEYDRLPATKRPQLSAPKPSRPPKLRKTTRRMASSPSEQPQPQPAPPISGPSPSTSKGAPAPVVFDHPAVPSSSSTSRSSEVPPPPTMNTALATSDSSPRPVETTLRREDDLMETDSESDWQGHASQNSALGFCQSLLSLPDFSPDISAVDGTLDHHPPPIRVPGLTGALDPFLASIAKDDWGCPIPPREDVDRLLTFYLSYTHELHPIFQVVQLRSLVSQLINGSKAARAKRQLGMAQVLLVLAMGSRCAVVSEAWDELSFVRSARAKIASAPAISSGLIRAKALLSIYYLDTQRYSDSCVVLGEAIAAARFLGYHLTETGQPVIWNTLVQLSLLHSFIIGLPHDATLLPLDHLQTSPFDEPLPSPLQSSKFTETSHSFSRFLSDAVALVRASPSDDPARFQSLDQGVRSWAPLLTDHDMTSPTRMATHDPRGKAPVSATATAEEEPATLFAQLHYVALSRLMLLVVRAPYGVQLTASAREGTVMMGEARFGKIDEAVRDAHEVVEACKMMRIYYDDFAASCGMLHLANAVASTVLCVYTLRHPFSTTSAPCKTDLMRLTVMMYDLIEEDPLARMGYAALLRMRERYEEKRQVYDEAQRSRSSRRGDVLDGLAFVAGEALEVLRPTLNGGERRSSADGQGSGSDFIEGLPESQVREEGSATRTSGYANGHVDRYTKDESIDQKPSQRALLYNDHDGKDALPSSRSSTLVHSPASALPSTSQSIHDPANASAGHGSLPPPNHWSFSASMTFSDIDQLTGHGGIERAWDDAGWVHFLRSLYPIEGPLYGGEYDNGSWPQPGHEPENGIDAGLEQDHLILFDGSDYSSAAALALAPASAAAAAGLLLLSPHPHPLPSLPEPKPAMATTAVSSAKQRGSGSTDTATTSNSNILGLYADPRANEPVSNERRRQRRRSSGTNGRSDSRARAGLEEYVQGYGDDLMAEMPEDEDDVDGDGDDGDGDWVDTPSGGGGSTKQKHKAASSTTARVNGAHARGRP